MRVIFQPYEPSLASALSGERGEITRTRADDREDVVTVRLNAHDISVDFLALLVAILRQPSGRPPLPEEGSLGPSRLSISSDMRIMAPGTPAYDVETVEPISTRKHDLLEELGAELHLRRIRDEYLARRKGMTLHGFSPSTLQYRPPPAPSRGPRR